MLEKQSEEKPDNTGKPEVLDKTEVLPREDTEEEKREGQLIEKVAAVVRREEFSGPIPHPSILEGYEKILPGSADRILRMAEAQVSHRHDLEKSMVKTESRDSLLGILCAFALGVACLITAVIIVLIVPNAASAIFASLLGMSGMGSIIIAFIKSTRSSGNNSEEGSKSSEQDEKKDTKH